MTPGRGALLLVRAGTDAAADWLDAREEVAALDRSEGWTSVELWRPGPDASAEGHLLRGVAVPMARDLRTVAFLVDVGQGVVTRVAPSGTVEAVGLDDATALPDLPHLVLTGGSEPTRQCVVIRTQALVAARAIVRSDDLALVAVPLEPGWLALDVVEGDAVALAGAVAELLGPAFAVCTWPDRCVLVAATREGWVGHAWGGERRVIGLDRVATARRGEVELALGVPRAVAAELHRVTGTQAPVEELTDLLAADCVDDGAVDGAVRDGTVREGAVPGSAVVDEVVLDRVLERLGAGTAGWVAEVLRGRAEELPGAQVVAPGTRSELLTTLVGDPVLRLPRWFEILCVLALPVLLALSVLRAGDLLGGQLGGWGAAQLLGAVLGTPLGIVCAVNLWRDRRRSSARR